MREPDEAERLPALAPVVKQEFPFCEFLDEWELFPELDYGYLVPTFMIFLHKRIAWKKRRRG